MPVLCNSTMLPQITSESVQGYPKLLFGEQFRYRSATVGSLQFGEVN